MHFYSSVGKELQVCRALMSKKPCLCGALLLQNPICVGPNRALWAPLHKCPVFEGVSVGLFC